MPFQSRHVGDISRREAKGARKSTVQVNDTSVATKAFDDDIAEDEGFDDDYASHSTIVDAINAGDGMADSPGSAQTPLDTDYASQSAVANATKAGDGAADSPSSAQTPLDTDYASESAIVDAMKAGDGATGSPGPAQTPLDTDYASQPAVIDTTDGADGPADSASSPSSTGYVADDESGSESSTSATDLPDDDLKLLQRKVNHLNHTLKRTVQEAFPFPTSEDINDAIRSKGLTKAELYAAFAGRYGADGERWDYDKNAQRYTSKRASKRAKITKEGLKDESSAVFDVVAVPPEVAAVQEELAFFEATDNEYDETKALINTAHQLADHFWNGTLKVYSEKDKDTTYTKWGLVGLLVDLAKMHVKEIDKHGNDYEITWTKSKSEEQIAEHALTFFEGFIESMIERDLKQKVQEKDKIKVLDWEGDFPRFYISEIFQANPKFSTSRKL